MLIVCLGCGKTLFWTPKRFHSLSYMLCTDDALTQQFFNGFLMDMGMEGNKPIKD